MVLIAPSSNALQAMLNKVSNWCNKWRITLNNSKTKVIHFRAKNTEQCKHEFKCGEMTVDYCEKYKYLGLWLHENLDFTVTTKELAQAGNRALGKIISTFQNSGGNAYNCFTLLFKSAILPILTYGSSVWGFKDFSHVSTIQNRAIRFFLGVPTQTPNIGTQGEMGWPGLLTHQNTEITRLWCKLVNMRENRLPKVVYNYAASKACGRCQNWVYKAKRVLRSIAREDLCDVNQNIDNVKHVVNSCKKSFLQLDRDKWCTALYNDRGKANGNKLRTYRLFKNNLEVETYLQINIPKMYRRILSMLRCGSLPLEVETGRYNKTPLNERICKLCNTNTIENEMHFTLNCPLYDDVRDPLMEKVITLNPDFNNYCDNEKFVFLMNCKESLNYLAKTLFRMFNRRRIFIHK